MTRTTVDLDASVLRELKGRAKRQGKSLGSVISEIVAPVLAERPRARGSLRWESAAMGARLDLEDKEALRRAVDES